METFSIAVNLTTGEGALASFGSGSGSRQALKRSTGAGGRKKASARQLASERSRLSRIEAASGGSRRERSAINAYRRVLNNRPTNREVQEALDRLTAATNLY